MGRGEGVSNNEHSELCLHAPTLSHCPSHTHAHMLHDRAMGRGKEGSNDELSESGLHIFGASHSLSLTTHAHTLHPTRSPTLYACTPTRPHTLVHA